MVELDGLYENTDIFKVAVSCWNEEAIRESYKYVKETHNMLIKLQVEHQIFGTPTEKLRLKVWLKHVCMFFFTCYWPQKCHLSVQLILISVVVVTIELQNRYLQQSRYYCLL